MPGFRGLGLGLRVCRQFAPSIKTKRKSPRSACRQFARQEVAQHHDYLTGKTHRHHRPDADAAAAAAAAVPGLLLDRALSGAAVKHPSSAAAAAAATPCPRRLYCSANLP